MFKFRNDLCLGKGFIVKYILLIFKFVYYVLFCEVFKMVGWFLLYLDYIDFIKKNSVSLK